jgi:putative transposase
MPRTARASVGGLCYHVLNRGNARAQVFHDDADYRTFLDLLNEASRRVPMRVLGFCLMPNHFHLVLWPRASEDLSRYLQWLLTAQVRRYHRRYRSSGHVWQGRFKAFPIERDEHLLTVLRYVERNALRAKLVRRTENWPWSSLSTPRAGFLHDSPVPLPRNWIARVNAPETGGELAALRQSVNRGTPFGVTAWVRRTAARLGLEASLRPRGRPRKAVKDALEK